MTVVKCISNQTGAQEKMSGHSKWASIKHKKAATDAKRGKLFSKIAKEIIIAAKMGGGDPGTNARLRTAIGTAKSARMPNDNIERAIKRGTGEIEGASYEELTYEAYGHGGVAILIEALTDNKNRTAADVRLTITRKNGNLASSGSVAWIFNKVGMIRITKEACNEDTAFAIATEAGADDFEAQNDAFEITTSPDSFEAVKAAFEEKEIEMELAEITFIPKNTVKVEGKEAKQVLALIEALEDIEDVQNVYANFDISDREIEEFSGDE